MRIKQIISLLIYFTCFSCDRAHNVENNETDRKEDSISRVQFLIHNDSIEEMFTSITIPHSWTAVKVENKRAINRKREDTLFVYKGIHIDISTAHQIDIICFPENGKSEFFNIKSIADYGDSVIFNTTIGLTNDSALWLFKHVDKEKSLGQWSIYDHIKKMYVVTGTYTSMKDQ